MKELLSQNCVISEKKCINEDDLRLISKSTEASLNESTDSKKNDKMKLNREPILHSLRK